MIQHDWGEHENVTPQVTGAGNVQILLDGSETYLRKRVTVLEQTCHLRAKDCDDKFTVLPVGRLWCESCDVEDDWWRVPDSYNCQCTDVIRLTDRSGMCSTALKQISCNQLHSIHLCLLLIYQAPQGTSNNCVYHEQSEFYFEPNESQHAHWCRVGSVAHSHVEEATRRSY